MDVLAVAWDARREKNLQLHPRVPEVCRIRIMEHCFVQGNAKITKPLSPIFNTSQHTYALCLILLCVCDMCILNYSYYPYLCKISPFSFTKIYFKQSY